MIQGYKLGEDDFRGRPLRQSHHRELKGNNDLLTLTKPDIIREIGHAYLEAGADIIETNTFNSRPKPRQADYGLAHLVGELNSKAPGWRARSATSARTSDRPRLVAGVLGPTNRTASISPDVNDPAFRNITFDELRETYREAARGLIKGGADVLMIETIFDTLNAKAAIFAIEEAFDGAGRAPAGVDFRHHHRSVRPHADGPDAGSLLAFGAPRQSVRRRPQLRAGRQGACAPMWPSCPASPTRWSAPIPMPACPTNSAAMTKRPDSMAEMIGEFARSGLVNIVGGCCGTTPEHIKAFGEAIAGVTPRAIPEKPKYLRLSGLEPFTLTPETEFRQCRRAHQHHRLGQVPQADRGQRL